MSNPVGDIKLLDKEKEKIDTPKMYQVLLLNDDFTPAEYVVGILSDCFNKTIEESVNLMMAAHQTGRVLCGIFSKDIALTKINKAESIASSDGHPLRFDIEQVD